MKLKVTKKKLERQYDTQGSIIGLAWSYGISQITMRKILVEMGIPIHKPLRTLRYGKK